MHMGFPNMWKTLWALIARPPHLAVAVRPDNIVAKVYVALHMPLCLQLLCKHAGVGPNLFRLLLVHLLHTVVAVADVRGIPCRSTWRQTQLSMHDGLFKQLITLARKQGNTPVQKVDRYCKQGFTCILENLYCRRSGGPWQQLVSSLAHCCVCEACLKAPLPGLRFAVSCSSPVLKC